jgi:hypothetical protein
MNNIIKDYLGRSSLLQKEYYGKENSSFSIVHIIGYTCVDDVIFKWTFCEGLLKDL